MLSESLTAGLAAYGVGDKLRRLRLKKKMGLVELGQHTGLSPAMLSKIERGRLFPTLPTLLRIAMVFSVGLEYFFSREDDKPRLGIVRRDERRRFPDDPSGKHVSFYFESLDFAATERKLNAYQADFEAVEPDAAAPHTHAGAEFIHVEAGTLGLRVERERVQLSAGDSIYFDSAQEHAYWRVGSDPCRAIVVTVP